MLLVGLGDVTVVQQPRRSAELDGLTPFGRSILFLLSLTTIANWHDDSMERTTDVAA